jgi:hypothetical protein
LPPTTFLTPLYIGDNDAVNAKLVFRAPGWVAAFRKPGRQRRQHSGLQLHIAAFDEEKAQRALDAIWSSHGILEFEAEDEVSCMLVHRAGVEYRAGIDVRSRASTSAFYPRSVLRACSLAAKAARQREHQYALAILHRSMSLHSNNPMQLDPGSARHVRLSVNPADHVRFAYAVVTSYAVIEQLGLEVRASQQNPSFINGAWNPPVKADLERRLTKAGVNLDDSAVWHLRGPRTRVEKARGVRALRRANWAWGPVRDIEVDVVDAIAGVSWLRSKVSAHRIGDLARSLSIYDVANAQYLARRLFLEVLGDYRYAYADVEA